MDINRKNIKRIVAGALKEPLATFDDNADLRNRYNCDSLTLYHLASVLEEHLNISEIDISEETLETLHTTNDFADFILENYSNA